MLINFDKEFKNTSVKNELPLEVIEYLQNTTPIGTYYKYDKTSNALFLASDKEIKFSGFKYVPSEEDKQFLGNDYTNEDVLAYFENAQKPLPLVLEKESIILVNGEEFEVEKAFAYNPFNPIKLVEGHFYLMPHKFEPVAICLGSDKYELSITINRVPNNSINVRKFASSPGALMLSYDVDDRNKKFDLNMYCDFSKASSVEEIVKAIDIYNAFVSKKGKFNGITFSNVIITKQATKIDKKNIAFWDKVLYVEKETKQKFLPPFDVIDNDTIEVVEEIYQSFKNCVPIKEHMSIDRISGVWTEEEHKKTLENLENNSALQFKSTCSISLFGCDFSLPSIVCAFNAHVKDISFNDDGTYLMVFDEKVENRYISMLLFKNRKRLNQYANRSFSIIDFKDAKTIKEVLLNG